MNITKDDNCEYTPNIHLWIWFIQFVVAKLIALTIKKYQFVCIPNSMQLEAFDAFADVIYPYLHRPVLVRAYARMNLMTEKMVFGIKFLDLESLYIGHIISAWNVRSFSIPKNRQFSHYFLHRSCITPALCLKWE